MNPPPFRVLLAEDQHMMRSALTLLLDLEPDLQVVAQVARGDRIVKEALRTRPHVALLDIDLPGCSGLDAAEALHRRQPDCKLVMLTAFGWPGYLHRALKAGASGFLVKDKPVGHLFDSIRQVMAGKQVIDPTLAKGLLKARLSPLTPREQEVLVAAAHGATVADIAKKVHLTEATVRNYLSAAIGKTGTRNRIEARHVALRNGWL